LLGVRKGIVALTKSDLVDAEWLGLMSEEVREYLRESFLADAPVITVSSRTGTGIEELKRELARLALEVEEKRSDGPFRLPVDRVFTVTGFGTVVTGTLMSGTIRVGDEAEILPSGLISRIRGVESHSAKSDCAGAGQRVAVNLQGVERSQVRRGDVVAAPGRYRTTRAIDARLVHLPSAPRELKNRATLRLHSATYETQAQVILLDRDSLKPGESTFAQLRLKEPVLLLPGDPFVLRSYSPPATLAGGRVLDPAPPRRRRRSKDALALLDALDSPDDKEKVRLLVADSLFSGISEENIAIRCGLPPKRLDAALAHLLSQGELVQAVREPRIFLLRDAFNGLKSLLLGEAGKYLHNNSMKEGIGKEELKTRLPRLSDPRFFGQLLTSLEKEGKVAVDRDLVKLTGRKAAATGEQSGLQEEIAALIQRAGMEPPTIKEIGDSLKRNERELLEHLNLLAREGRVIKVRNDIFYAPEAVEAIREKLVAHLKEQGEIIPGEFRELTGLSRKFMIPLLEYFDKEKLTIRVGDKRLLRKGQP
jgi:selenocysteine-specific elongation factor